VPVLSVVRTAAPVPPLGLAAGLVVGAGEAVPVGPVFLLVPEPVTEPGGVAVGAGVVPIVGTGLDGAGVVRGAGVGVAFGVGVGVGAGGGVAFGVGVGAGVGLGVGVGVGVGLGVGVGVGLGFGVGVGLGFGVGVGLGVGVSTVKFME
jgi:hypothetical protein